MGRTLATLLLAGTALILAGSITPSLAFFATSSVTETGATNIVSVPFPYINQTDVSVYVNGVLTTAYTWPTSSTIQMTASAASLSGSTIMVVRNTGIASPDVTFTSGGLDPADLNTVVLQQLYSEQEATDAASRTLQSPPGSNALGLLPSPAQCASATLGFDSTGLNPICVTITGGGSVVGPSSTTPGHLATWNSTNGTLLGDTPAVISNSMLGAMAAHTFKGNPTSSSAVPSDMTAAQAWTLLQMGGGTNSVLANGADPTGVADSTAAFQAALNGAVSGALNWGSVVIPCGKYKVSGVSATVHSGQGLTIQGGGADCTIIDSTTGSTPLTLTLTDFSSSFHVRDVTVATGAANVGTGIAVSQTTSNNNPADSAPSDFTNVTVRGDDCYACTFYFTTGISINGGVSNVNFNDVMMPGDSAIGGIGVALQGDTINSRYGVVYNFIGGTLNYLNVGVVYGSYIQGVDLQFENLTGGNYGLETPVSAGGSLSQLTIVGGQFNERSAIVLLNTPVWETSIQGATFSIAANGGVGILGEFEVAAIVGNTFMDTAYTSCNAFVTTTGSVGVQVTGNVFYGGWTTAVWFQTGTTYSSAQSNTYDGPVAHTSPTSTTGTVTIGGGSP